MGDVTIRVTAEVRDRLTDVAAAEGLSLRAYLEKLAHEALTPRERAAKTRQAVIAMSGYDPAQPDPEADAELTRRLDAAREAAA
jgi:hypothetical protein